MTNQQIYLPARNVLANERAWDHSDGTMYNMEPKEASPLVPDIPRWDIYYLHEAPIQLCIICSNNFIVLRTIGQVDKTTIMLLRPFD